MGFLVVECNVIAARHYIPFIIALHCFHFQFAWKFAYFSVKFFIPLFDKRTKEKHCIRTIWWLASFSSTLYCLLLWKEKLKACKSINVNFQHLFTFVRALTRSRNFVYIFFLWNCSIIKLLPAGSLICIFFLLLLFVSLFCSSKEIFWLAVCLCQHICTCALKSKKR